MDDLDITIPDWLIRKEHPEYNTPLPANVSWKLKNHTKIVWPAKQIERVMKAKARAARLARKAKKG